MSEDMHITEEFDNCPDIEDVCYEQISELEDWEMQLIATEKEIESWNNGSLANRAPDPKHDEHYFMLLGWREHLAKKVKELKRKNRKELNTNKMVAKALSIHQTDVHTAKSLGFMARSFVLATMPHSKPKSNEFTRVNGDYTLNMWAPIDVGLPYGAVPRLFLAYITKQIKKTKSRDISLGDNLSSFMKELGLIPTGGRWGTITNLKKQILKMLECTIRVRYQTTQERDGIKLDIADKYHLWWEDKNPNQKSLFPSEIRISEGFFDDVMENAVPLDMRVLKELKGSAFALDVYMFLTHRLAYLKHETVIPYKVLFNVFGSSFKEVKAFKFNFKKALKKVCLYVPEFNVFDHHNGLKLEPSKLHINRKNKC